MTQCAAAAGAVSSSRSQLRLATLTRQLDNSGGVAQIDARLGEEANGNVPRYVITGRSWTSHAIRSHHRWVRADTFDREALQKKPPPNLTLNKPQLQATGVVRDSYGGIHSATSEPSAPSQRHRSRSISGFGTTLRRELQARSQLSPARCCAQYGSAPRAKST
jgi:hypothetical protein